MTSRHARLDRHLSATLGIGSKAVKPLLASGQVVLNGEVIRDAAVIINQFDRIECEGVVLPHASPVYLMLNKPAGVVSATRDDEHVTVMDLLGESAQDDLHIVGRLDFNSTGLLLLTNDGRWSKSLSHPDKKVAKRYRVTTADPVTEDMVSAFSQGMYFPYEDITTLPVELIIMGDREVEVVLKEGRYHQIKRMFGRFQNEVLTIHRTATGDIRLDPGLAPGSVRPLTAAEIASVSVLPR